MSTCNTITVPTLDGGLTIDSVDMRNPAWCVRTVDELWLEADINGTNLDLPGYDGQLAEADFRVATRRDLDLIVIGDCDSDGTPYSNNWVGLETNLAYLHTNVLSPPETGDGTRLATLTKPSGDTLTARIKVTPRLELQQARGTDRLYTMTITIPKGRFV